MTTLLLLMGFLVLAVAGLALGLWQMVRLRRHGHRTAPAQLSEPAPLRSYGPMARLFEVGELQFLQSQRGYEPAMGIRLRLERRAVLSLYLRQVRADFRCCWTRCRAMAAFGESPEFAAAAVKQFLAFYTLYAALRVHCLVGFLVYVPTDVGGLLRVLQRLQQRSRQVVGQRAEGFPAVNAR
jgi:hypothetical protein